MRRITAIAAVMMVAGLMSSCGMAGDSGPVTIVSVTWSQSQAVESFDSAPGETTDADELARLAEILTTHGLQNRAVSVGDNCPGGRSTELTYETDTGDSHHIGIAGCDRGEAGDAIDDLVSEWRTNR